MLNEISIAAIIIIIILPFLLKGIFRLNDYYGYIMGIRYLIISSIVGSIYGFIIPGSSDIRKNSNQELEELLKLSFQDRLKIWLYELIKSVLEYLVLYFCISQLAKPTQNYNNIFLYITGICIQYVFPFVLYLIIPILSTKQTFKEIIEKDNKGQYFTEEYLLKSLRKTICKLLGEIGINLLMLFSLKKLISKRLFFFNYFLNSITRLLIICCGLAYLDNYMNIFYACPFVFGVYYFSKLVGNGQLNNNYKESAD